MQNQTPKDPFLAGEHCQKETCNRLDFLPVRCDGCRKTFCNDHFRYEQHTCSSGKISDNQVPVCPLCNAPIPIKRGEIPDVHVSRHIDMDCQSETALGRKTKAFGNACSLKGCKKKEVMRVECNRCNLSFCLAHRFPDDHKCEPVTVSRAGLAALKRFVQSADVSARPSGSQLDKRQQQLSSDEAYAKALQRSMNPGGSQQGSSRSEVDGGGSSQRSVQGNNSQEEEDLALALALSASEAEFESRRNNGAKTNCVVA